MRILFAGSGSGGHLRPALALAAALREIDSDSDVLFCTPGGELEDRFFAGTGIRRTLAPSVRVRTIDLPGLSHAARRLRIVREFRPELAVGTGGGAGIVPLLGARLAGAPLVLLEPNRVAGRANRLLARLARRVLTQFPGTESTLPAGTVVECCGLPVRSDVIASCSPERARRSLGLDPGLRTLLVLGGSQGAASLNERLPVAASMLTTVRQGVQVLHVSGPGKDAGLDRRYREAGVPARVVPFLDDVATAYRASDLAVSRAGGSTLAELAAVGLPSVLVPYPGNPDRHQFLNAGRFVAAGAAVLHDETVDPAESLGSRLVALLGSGARDGTLEAMAANAARLGNPHAGRDAARILFRVAGVEATAHDVEAVAAAAPEVRS